ncbi:MAG: hypothetical protein ABJK39_09205 [Hyphomicrobiales bacterium]
MPCNPMTPAKAIAEYDFHQKPVSATCDLIELCVAATKQNWTLAGLFPISRSRGRVSAGFASKISKNITGYVEHQGIFSSNDQEHAARTGIKFKS